MKIFLDDVRDCPEGFTLCRDADTAIRVLSTEKVSLISFDHDLGEGKTGYDVAKFIEERCYDKKMKCPLYSIHSANPVGRTNIERAMVAAKKFSITSEEKYGVRKQPPLTCPMIDNVVKGVDKALRALLRFERDKSDADALYERCKQAEWELNGLQDDLEEIRRNVDDIRGWGQEWKDIVKANVPIEEEPS